jgi:hypothetical protein
MRIGGDSVNLSNGLLNLTNWLGNVIMPTMAGLFAAAAVYRFSKGHPFSHLGYAALASLMCSGLLVPWSRYGRRWFTLFSVDTPTPG